MSVGYGGNPDPWPDHINVSYLWDGAIDVGTPGLRMLKVRPEHQAEWGRYLWEHVHRIVYEGDAAEMVGMADEFIVVAPRITKHTIVSDDPLTVTPSLLCSCGLHGYVTDGVWRSC